MHIQERHLKALLLQLLEGMENGMMLKGCGDDVLLSGLLAERGGAADGLVVGLAAAGGEKDLTRLGVDDCSDIGAGLLQALLCVLADGIKAGGVAVVSFHTPQHRVNGGAAHLCGGRVVCVYLHSIVSFGGWLFDLCVLYTYSPIMSIGVN